MDFDDSLQAAWQHQTPQVSAAGLMRRVRRQQRLKRLQRGFEVTLTLVAIAVLGQAFRADTPTPQAWLLLPFFAVYLPLAWRLILRAPSPQHHGATETSAIYARLRLQQLRSSLRELQLARIAALALLAYAVVVTGVAWTRGAGDWLQAGWQLLAFSLLWAIGTLLLCRRLAHVRQRESQAVERLLQP